MKLLPKPISFEWDKGNIDKNWIRHRVTNKETEEVFENNPKLILKDEKHSDQEDRYLVLGITDDKRRLAIIFTIRKDKIRVISARVMHSKERRLYEEKFKNYPKI